MGEKSTLRELWENAKNTEARIGVLKENFDTLDDGEGKTLDEGVKEIVLNFLEAAFPTTGSCEGHLRHTGGLITRLQSPYLTVGATNAKERYVGELEFERSFKEKYQIPDSEDIIDHENYEAEVDGWRESIDYRETPEFQRDREESKILQARVEELLTKFYHSRKVDDLVRLKVASRVCGFRLEPESLKSLVGIKTISELQTILDEQLAELQEFSEFVKEHHTK